MRDVIEISYTGDLLAHRRCRRAWAYEKRAGFQPYEAVQAMEGRLIHHAMQWLVRQFHEANKKQRHADPSELRLQLDRYFKVLWARGIRTAFASKQETLDRVMDNLFPGGRIDPIVKAAVEGAQHSEYELRAIKKVLPAQFAGKSRILITGVLDLVIQQQDPLTYERRWVWDSISDMRGHTEKLTSQANRGDVEIWDYKGTRANTAYIADYVRQVLTYAALYEERTLILPRRCVLFFVNEPPSDKRLLAIDVAPDVVQACLKWTETQVRQLQATDLGFQNDPISVMPGELDLAGNELGSRITPETTQQCTTCGLRFDCPEYSTYLAGGTSATDVDIYNVLKN